MVGPGFARRVRLLYIAHESMQRPELAQSTDTCLGISQLRRTRCWNLAARDAELACSRSEPEPDSRSLPLW